jgi:hypothetical protein
MASPCSAGRSVSNGIATVHSEVVDDYDRYATKTIIAHELFHVIGAGHLGNGNSLMHGFYTAFRYPEYPVLLPASVEEIRECLEIEKEKTK